MSEILAPAGSFDMMYAAVRAGADAVYFGLDKLNARRNAENFNCESVAEYAAYCRRRGVKTYLTLNTLVSDRELGTALSLLKTACDVGIDGIIIQDMGLVSLARKCAPKMPLHASTQMAVHDPRGVEFLSRLGFKRVVVARENSADELREICKTAAALGVEVEAFVQGALCMCVSGQCLASAVLGGRSGNRGLCAGTCRLPFCVQGGKTDHALSLKDLSLLEYFDELSRIGVCSFKIEGRMKRPEYAAAAVAAAVAARDKSEDRALKAELLKNTFSRSGFTDGYYKGNIGFDMFGIRSEQDISSSKKTAGIIHNFYRTEYPKIPVSFSFSAHKGENVILIARDNENEVTLRGEVPMIADTSPTPPALIEKKLCKLGNTGCYAGKIEIDADSGLRIDLGELSKLRSEALSTLGNMREKFEPVPFEMPKLKEPRRRANRKPVFALSVHNAAELPDDLSGINIVILPLFTENSVITALLGQKEIWVKTPPVIFGKGKLIEKRLCELRTIGVKTAVAENIGTLEIINSSGLKAVGGPTLNCFNSYAPGGCFLDKFIVSRELSYKQIEQLDTDAALGVEIYGKTPVMTVRNCPVKANVGCENCTGFITDRRESRLPVMCEDGVTRIYNDRPTYLLDKPETWQTADFCVISLTDETRGQAEKLLKLLKANAPCDGEFTRGLILSGVK